MKYFFYMVSLVTLVCFVGCETPYGTLGVGDIDDYINGSKDDLVCLSDGFDTICIKTIAGPRGKPGRDGRDGRDGAVVRLELEKILTVTEREIFILYVTRTEMTYQTPVGAVYVPEDAPVVAPVGVTVTALEGSVSETLPSQATLPSADPLPVGDTVPAGDSEIWHVMYRNDGGAVTVFVYPRCFNNAYHNPPRPECENAHGIDADTFFEVSPAFNIEMQGDKESVRELLDRALEADSASVVDIGGVQGIVN